MRTAVIVIGDLGRSPRMQYHAASLAAARERRGSDRPRGRAGDAGGGGESAHSRHRLPDRAFANRAKGGVRRFVFSSAARGLGQAVRSVPHPDAHSEAGLILVQNPPAFPTLAIAWLAARLRGARFVIDWHNLSHTIAAVRLGERHRAVKSIARSERRWARRRDGAPRRVAGARGMAGARIQSESRRSSTIGRRRLSRRPSAADASFWERLAATANSARRARRSSCVRRAGRRTRISICCSKRSSAPSGRSTRRTGSRGRRVPLLAVFLTGRGAAA